MKTIQNLFRQLSEFLRFGQEVIVYAPIWFSRTTRDTGQIGLDEFLEKDNFAER